MKWQNWSGSVTCRPRVYSQPRNEAEIGALIQKAGADGNYLRVAGSGHSFVPLVGSDQMMMDLSQISGCIEIGEDEAWVWAGTRLHDLGKQLYQHGLAQENLGDIDHQTIAGAISTGTHGTGADFASISSQILELRLITGTGEILDCSREQNPEIFDAARVSLGSLGVITRVKLRLQKAYKLRYQSRICDFFECLEIMHDLAAKHRHFEFYWFPYSDRVQLKTCDETEEHPRGNGLGRRLNEYLLENAAFWSISQLCRFFPSLAPSVSRLCAALIETGERVDQSHRIFATRRMVRFMEMEYALPVERLEAVLREIHTLTARNRYRVHFPLEIRFAAAGEPWLSPCFGRETAYVAVHMYKNMPFENYFAELEKVFITHHGRPHWGKWHTCTGDHFSSVYPHWAAFGQVGKKLDPKGIFQSPYLKKLCL